MKKISISVLLEEEDYNKLKELSTIESRSMASYIRNVINYNYEALHYSSIPVKAVFRPVIERVEERKEEKERLEEIERTAVGMGRVAKKTAIKLGEIGNEALTPIEKKILERKEGIES